MSAHAAILGRLSAIDTCALSDALDKLGLAGQVTELRREAGEGRIAGVAITVKLDDGPPQEGLPVHLCTKAIDLADSESVIVVEQRSGRDAGCWGGLLTRGALRAGVRGVVADGPVRDIDEARELGFPVFTNALTCFTARGRVVERATNVPVEIGAVTVHPGDYVVADGAAVIVIRPDKVEAVLAAAEEICAREAAMIAAMGSGRAMREVLGGSYEDMLKGEENG